MLSKSQIIDKFCVFLVEYIAPKVNDPLKKFKIGMISAGVGRKRIETMCAPLFDSFTFEDGSVDLSALRKAVRAGFSASEKIPIEELGVSLDCGDAEAFFTTL